MVEFAMVRRRDTDEQVKVTSISNALAVLKDAGIRLNHAYVLKAAEDRAHFLYFGYFSERQGAWQLIERPVEQGPLEDWIKRLFYPFLQGITDCRVIPTQDYTKGFNLVLYGQLNMKRALDADGVLTSQSNAIDTISGGYWYALGNLP